MGPGGSGISPTSSFPRATQIVDLFHAKEHLSEVARAIYGSPSDLATIWTEQRYEELDAGELDALLTVLRKHQSSCEEARKAAAYFQRNHHRMRYDRFRAALSAGFGSSSFEIVKPKNCRSPVRATALFEWLTLSRNRTVTNRQMPFITRSPARRLRT